MGNHGHNSGPPNKGMKLTKPERNGALQLIPGVRRTRGRVRQHDGSMVRCRAPRAFSDPRCSLQYRRRSISHTRWRDAAVEEGTPAQLIGAWRGTSICDRPHGCVRACPDETVVYEFTAGARSGARSLGRRQGRRRATRVDGRDGSCEYDEAAGCWKGFFTLSARQVPYGA